MEKEGYFSASTARNLTIAAIRDKYNDAIEYIYNGIGDVIGDGDFSYTYKCENSVERSYLQKFFEFYGYKTTTINAEQETDEGWVDVYELRITWFL